MSQYVNVLVVFLNFLSPSLYVNVLVVFLNFLVERNRKCTNKILKDSTHTQKMDSTISLSLSASIIYAYQNITVTEILRLQKINIYIILAKLS